MLNLLSSVSSLPAQGISIDAPFGPLLIAALGVVLVLAGADVARSRLVQPRAPRRDLRVVHSH